MSGALAGKAIIVTGSSRGIGAAIARLAAREGALVVINGSDAAAVGSVVAEILGFGGTAVGCVQDVSTWGGAEALVACCVTTFGRIDGLVNNAAVQILNRVDQVSEEEVRRQLDVNVAAPAFLARHAAPHMMRQGGGAIVNLTSGVMAGRAHMAVYGATKAAVAALVYAWAQDLGPCGIRVNGLSPLAETRLTQDVANYLAARGEQPPARVRPGPDTVAPAAVFLLSDLAHGVTGQTLRTSSQRLSLISPPAVALPTRYREQGWDLAAIAEVFRDDFGKRLFAPGLRGFDIRGTGDPDA